MSPLRQQAITLRSRGMQIRDIARMMHRHPSEIRRFLNVVDDGLVASHAEDGVAVGGQLRWRCKRRHLVGN